MHSHWWWIPALLCSVAAAAQQDPVRLLDPQKVSIQGNPLSWIVEVRVPQRVREIECDVLVAGGGTGGVAAALTAARTGRKVCLTEETDWLGGQFTSQGVSAFDDHRFIEEASGTGTYYDLRHRIRELYRTRYRLSELGKSLKHFNPGNCYVSPLCFEPPVGVAAIDALLAPEIRAGYLETFLRTRIFRLESTDRLVTSALAYRFDTTEVVRFKPKYVLDATEQGDLLPLAGVRYYSGAESRAQTGETHAPERANPACVQAITYTFALEHRPGERAVIPRPPDYERLRDAQPYTFHRNFSQERGWRGPITYRMFGDEPPIPHTGAALSFFPWRRLVDRRLFDDRRVGADIAMINWPSNDYRFESIIDRTPEAQARILQEAKRLSLGFVHWLQTEVPRDDGRGRGYPELQLRNDVMGTADGLSKFPYIRESRRIAALRQVIHEDTGISFHKTARARWFEDSVGLGLYMIDIHPCGKGETGVDEPARPFQVPARALLSPESRNLIAAAKNIGITHITNGAYRMHPVEWNVGEAAGALAAFALDEGIEPGAVVSDPRRVRAYQARLIRLGVPIVWFDDIKAGDPGFEAIQWLAIHQAFPMSDAHLHAHPGAPVSRGEAAWMLARVFAPADLEQPYKRIFDLRPDHPHATAAQAAIQRGWMIVDHRNWFHADEPLFWGDVHRDKISPEAGSEPFDRLRPVSRVEFSRWLAELLR